MADPTHLTIFYSKLNGNIFQYATGIESMAYFNKFEAEHSLGFDFIVIPYEPKLTRQLDSFKVDLATKVLILSTSGEDLLVKYQQITEEVAAQTPIEETDV